MKSLQWLWYQISIAYLCTLQFVFKLYLCLLLSLAMLKCFLPNACISINLCSRWYAWSVAQSLSSFTGWPKTKWMERTRSLPSIILAGETPNISLKDDLYWLTRVMVCNCPNHLVCQLHMRQSYFEWFYLHVLPCHHSVACEWSNFYLYREVCKQLERLWFKIGSFIRKELQWNPMK